MPFIPVPNVGALVAEYTQVVTGYTWTNGFDFLSPSPWTTTTLESFCAEFEDAWVESMPDVFVSGVRLTNIKIVDLTTVDGPFGQRVPDPSTQGSRAGTLTALHTACVVTERTAQRGRSFRGRLYHTGLANQDLATTKQWFPLAASIVQNRYETLVNAMETVAGVTHVVVSRQQGNVVLPVGVATPIDEYVGRTAVGTVRGRVRQ